MAGFFVFTEVCDIFVSMELRQLKYFIAVAKTLNFSEAARRLYITQGTLSQQIRQLESELGSQLFERTSRNVSLTEAGEELLPYALETIAASQACMTKMNDLKGALAGTLRIGAVMTFKGMLTKAVRSFTREHPGVNLDIQFATAEELQEMLKNKEIDMALAYRSVIEDEDVESEVLFQTSLHVVMRKDHPLADEGKLSMEQLKGRGVIIPGKGLQARRSFDRFMGIDTRRLTIKVETNDPDMAMDLVQGSKLLAISSPLPIEGRNDLTALTLDDGRYHMDCCVHRLKGSYRKKSAELFLVQLRNFAGFERFAKNLEGPYCPKN